MKSRPETKAGGEGEAPAADTKVEHPQRLSRRREPYRNRMLQPQRSSGYDTKKE